MSGAVSDRLQTDLAGREQVNIPGLSAECLPDYKYKEKKNRQKSAGL